MCVLVTYLLRNGWTDLANFFFVSSGLARARFSYKMQSSFLTLTIKVHSKYIEYIVLLHVINRLSAVTLHF